MQRKASHTKMRARRWDDFRHRVEYAPRKVYQHRARGWEYIPIHPFGDEPEDSRRLKLRPENCWGVDAWWGIDGDATLLQSAIVTVAQRPAGLYAKLTPHWEGWVYLLAIFEAPYVTREAFEEAMCRFADAGFPSNPRFQLREGDPWLVVHSGHV